MELTSDGGTAVRVPERLDGPGLEALSAALDAAGRGPIVLRGATSEVFCDGLDLAAALAESDSGDRGFGAFAEVLGRLARSPLPTLAVVDGHARGGGVGLLAACDRVLATERARFALPELLFGLIPGTIWPVLVERMRPSEARCWALSAVARDAPQALAAGLVDRVVPAVELADALEVETRALSRVHGAAVVQLRRWAARAGALPLDEALAEGAKVARDRLEDPSVRDGLRRFLEDGEAPWMR